MNELEINTVDEYYSLEELITEGTESRVPIEIEFPDGRKAQALIRPITTGEFRTVYNGNAAELLVNVLATSLMDKSGNSISPSLIKKMPVGLPAQIVQQIFEISGIKTNPEDAEKLKEELELFP